MRWRLEGSKVAAQNLEVYRKEKDYDPQKRLWEMVAWKLSA
jgi:hypothetical protein